MDVIEVMQNEAWCPYPWSDLSSDTGGHYKLCCWSNPLSSQLISRSPSEHWNSPQMREVRTAMLAGDRATLRKLCETCHLEEDSGADSPRLRRLREMRSDPLYLDAMQAAVKQTIESGDGSAPMDYFRRVDLRVAGNLCNLRCVMCSPQSSSAIAQEMKRLGRLSDSVPTFRLPTQDMTDEKRRQFWRELAEILPRTQGLYFAGGEPFLSEPHYQVLDLAIELGLTQQISLMYSTNLTCLETVTGRMLTEYLNQFGRVKLLASVDNLHAKNDYIRYGSTFSKFVENIAVIRRACPHVEVEPATCVSIFNILDLADIYAFFQSHCSTHSFVNLLVHPPVLRATNLPAELKQDAASRLSRFPDVFQSQIHWLQQAIEPAKQAQAFGAFARYVEQIDQARGTSFRGVFPEFTPYLA